MSFRLALADNLPQQRLQTLHIIMLERPDMGSTQPYTEANGCMVKLIRDDQTPLPDKRWNERRIGRKTHRTDKCVLHSNKAGDKSFASGVEVIRTTS
jgi:hypothetical protein